MSQDLEDGIVNIKEFSANSSRFGENQINIFILIILVIGICLLLIPAFIYNELEYKFRQYYFEASYEFEKTDHLILVRKSETDPLGNEKDFTQMGKDIEIGVSGVISQIEKANNINRLQSLIPFLSPKYASYHKQKKEATDEYLVYFKEFKEKKQNDHMLADATLDISKSGEFFRNLDREEDFWKKMEDQSKIAKDLSSNAQKLYLNGFITKELYEYLTRKADMINFIYIESQKVKEAGSWEGFDSTGLEAFYKQDENVIKIYEDSNKISVAESERLTHQFNLANDLISKSSKYYDSNNLAFDNLSKIISRFSSVFPRNNNSGANNLFVPPDIEPNLVSMLVSPIH